MEHDSLNRRDSIKDSSREQQEAVVPRGEWGLAVKAGSALVDIMGVLRQSFGGDITLALVLIEIWLRFAKVSGKESPARYINAYSISLSSGIPRETVRRKVKILIEKNWVVAEADGSLSINQSLQPPLHEMFRPCQETVWGIMQREVTGAPDSYASKR